MESHPVFKKKVLFRALNSALGFFIFGFSLGAFTSSQDCIASILEWNQQRELIIIIVSSLVPLGAFIGSIFTSFMSKRFGERKNIMISDCIMILATLIVIYPNTITLCIYRLLSGICAGSFSILCSQYTSKVTPKKIRGKLGALNQVFVLSGLFTAYSLCIPLPIDNCKPSDGFIVFTLFIFPGLVAFFQFLMFLKYFKKETPLYLVRHEQSEQALEAIESIYWNDSVQDHYGSLLKDNQIMLEKNGNETYKDIICCAKTIRKPLRVCLIFHIISQLTGINAILAFTTRMIIKDFGEGVFQARIYTSCITLSRIVFVILILPLLDRHGRKSITIKGQLLMCFFMAGIATLVAIEIIPLLKVLCLAGYLIIFSVSSGPIVWIYCSEVVPDKGVALCTSINWLVGFIVVMVVPVLIEIYPPYYTFSGLAMIDLFGAVYVQFELIETRGLSRHEIITKYSS